MERFSKRKPSEDELLGCWEIVSCRLSDENYPSVEGVKFQLEEGGDLVWRMPPALEQEADLPFFSCETFVYGSFEGELICYGSDVDRIGLKCVLESNQLVLCYDKHLRLCCQKVDQVESQNPSRHPYTLLPALEEGFFTDITLIANNGAKLLAHKTVLCCFFPDIFTSDKIPSFLTDISPAVLHGLLHYFYTCSLPLDITEKTAKELLRISQLDLKSFGNVGELCTEFLEATAVKNRIRCLMSELYNILENILHMTESLAAGLRHNNNPSKIVDVAKMALRQLAVGIVKFVLLCETFTKHKSDLSRDERQEIIQNCRKRLPGFVELVEKFLIIFQATLSGLSNSEKEQVALCLIPEIEKMWTTSTQLGNDAHTALETITQRADKDHKKKTHLPKMATSLSRTLRNAVHLREVLTLKRFHQKVSSSLMFMLQKRGDFSSLSEEQKLRSVVKSMDKILLEIPDQVRSLHKFPRVFEKKLPWKEWKHSFKVWTSFVSLALRKVLANRDILEPVVEQTSSLVHEEEFTHLVKELGFLKGACDENKAHNPTPTKKSTARVESVVTCPPGDKSPLARSVMQLLISGDHADMRFILDKTDSTHCSTCEGFQGIRNQNTLEIPAHRVIVATRCDWFRRALLSGMKESIERRILIPDTSPCLFLKFLEYVYSGTLDTRSLSLDEIPEMLALSDKYEMDSLKEICEGMLLRDVDQDTVLLYLSVAEQFTVHRLKEECLHYITTHPEVMDSDIFQELPCHLKEEVTDKVHQSMPQVHPITEEVRQAFAVTTVEDFEDLIERDTDDSDDHDDDDDDDDDDDVMPRGNSQVERCIETLRGILGDTVPRRELLRVTLAADCDTNRALNFYFS